MKNLVLIVFLSVSAGVRSQVYSGGKCPEVTTQKTLDLKEYMGTWYEVFKFPTSFETNQKCNTALYTLKENGHVNVTNVGLGTDGSSVRAEGDGYVPSEEEPAKLLVRFSDAAPYAKYWVLDTDYKTYTLIYSCTNLLGLSHIEFAWILSREKTISEEDKNKLFEELQNFKVKTDNFLTTDQSNCPPFA